MKLLEKTQDEIRILAGPQEEVERGEFLYLEDKIQQNKLILQVMDVGYLNLEGSLDDIIRRELLGDYDILEVDPNAHDGFSRKLQDLKEVKCKIRGEFSDNSFHLDFHHLPMRSRSEVAKAKINDLLGPRNASQQGLIRIGKTKEGEAFHVRPEDLDGRLGLITGRKNSGKSHLAKILASALVIRGAFVFVLDLNDEYLGLSSGTDGKESRLAKRIIPLSPGESLQFDVKYLGLDVMVEMMKHTLEMPTVSLREFSSIWNMLSAKGNLSLATLETAIPSWRCNQFVKEALFSRFQSLKESNLFSDDVNRGVSFEELINNNSEGGMFVLSLGSLSSIARRVVVEVVLGKIMDLLKRQKIPPLFLFAEEAHTYVRETWWEDIITRMRHFGIFTTFVTNQPDAIGRGIYRQMDNIFLYNFNNENDLDLLSQASASDGITIRSLVKGLSKGSCLVLGDISNDLPLLVDIDDTELQTLGKSRLFFKKQVEPIQTARVVEGLANK
ncbi:MAG: ATP-binding protein [Nitrososphaerales archaeon]